MPYNTTQCENEEELPNLNNLFIRLPQYQQTFLIALQNRSDGGIFTTFDNDFDLCVVDNCANVHIWNNRSDFISGSYIKFNTAASTSVYTVNGESNKPDGCEDVPVSWKDDYGRMYSITLKNVLYFPNSPVKNIKCCFFS